MGVASLVLEYLVLQVWYAAVFFRVYNGLARSQV